MSDERGVFLSTLPPGPGARRLALAIVLVSLAIFLAVAPFAKVPLGPVWAFIPIYQSALVVNDLITAVLLFGQFTILRSRALFVLASGYLFTAFMTVSHTLTFPGLFSPTGLLGAGQQSTAWLYMFWHGGFPLLVIVYALLKDAGPTASRVRGHAGMAVLFGFASVLVVAGGLTLLATAGQHALPAIMRGHRYTPVMIVVVSSVWGLSTLALAVLWRRRPHSVLDLWLGVVMCVWLFDIALAAVLNGGRFDLGFYAGRIYGLLAASFVLLVLMLENGMLYARLATAHDSERQERQRAQRAEEALERHNRSLEQTVAERTQQLLHSEKLATMGSLLAGVAHELRNPLTVIDARLQLFNRHREDTPARFLAQVRALEDATERMKHIVTGLSNYARPTKAEAVMVDLNDAITSLGELLAYQARNHHVVLQAEPAPTPTLVRVERSELTQILVNLAMNAVEAMTGTGGTLTLRTRIEADGRHIVVEIADTGPGIPAEQLDQIWEAFYTTKPDGSGLGLSIVRALVEKQGGVITVQSRAGAGTTFSLALPRAGAVPTEPGRAIAPSGAGSEI